MFLTLDDGTGPVDATFFEDAQGPYAATLFHSWLLVVRGELRRTGPKGVSLRATGCWELPALHDIWQRGGVDAVHDVMQTIPAGFGVDSGEQAVQGAAESESTRPVMAQPPSFDRPGRRQDRSRPARRQAAWVAAGCWCTPAGSSSRRTPTSNRPARPPSRVPRKLWHRSPGSSG